MNARSLSLFFAVFATLIGWVAPASAQVSTVASEAVLVYRISFRPMADSINFHSYQGGYYVADVLTGQGTMILTKVLGSTRRYYTLTDYGAIFHAVKLEEHKAVFTAAKFSATQATNIAFQASGDADKSQKYNLVNGQLQLNYANKLEGIAFFADALESQPFAASSGLGLGTAATVHVTLTLQDGLTESSRKTAIGRDEMITKLKAQLAEQDYTSGDTGGTGGGTTTP